MSEKDQEKEKPGSSVLVVTDQEQDLAQAALADFTKGNYVACLSNLTALEATWTHDSKVAHNKIVAEFYKSELKKTDHFRKTLNGLRSQPILSGEEVVGLDDVEQCVLYYNHAVVLFHLKQYNTGKKIIEEVYSFIEPMEESLAHKVCLLLIEVHLRTRQVSKALEYVSYITLQFASTKNIQGLDQMQDPAEKKQPVFDAATDAFRLKLVQCQSRAYLMGGLLRESERELHNLVATGGGNNPSVIFMQANLEYLKRNYMEAVKVLNSLQGYQLPGLKECGEALSMHYFNNLGCIYHYMGKPNLACFYLQKALRENEDVARSGRAESGAEPLSGRPLFTLSASKNPELMYNMGVALLYAGKPCKAFDCLTEAVQVFHMNPRLWLRMAECCIMVHKASNEEDFNIHVRKNDIVQSVVGSGLHRKLVLASRMSKVNQCQSETQSYAIPTPSLEFASLCLKNTLHLLPPEERGELGDSWQSTSPSQSAGSTEPECAFYGAPSNPMDINEVVALRCSALANAAYVALCLGDYLIALEHARDLLTQQNLSGAHRMLGHLYAAEALILTDRISDAMDHLNPDLVPDVNVRYHPTPDKQTRPLKEWYPNNILTAKVLMQYHLAVALAIRGEYEKSFDTLKHVWMRKNTCELPIQVVMLALYIELQLGHADNSIAIINQHCPHMR